MEYPLISVVILTKDRPQFLARAISSVIDQDYPNKMIVLLNNGGSGIDFEKFANSLKEVIPTVYGDSKTELSLPEIRQMGIRASLDSKADWIVFLDDDDILLPHALSFRMSMAQKYKAEVVYTRALRDIWEKNNEGEYVSIHKELYWDSDFSRDLLLIQNITANCGVMFSKVAYENCQEKDDIIPIFDPNLEVGEDWDFWIMLSRYNEFLPLKIIDCECSYRTDGSQLTGTADFSKSYLYIFKKWRKFAEDKEKVAEFQNDILRKLGINPEEVDWDKPYDLEV